jgi:hypothetical protein
MGVLLYSGYNKTIKIADETTNMFQVPLKRVHIFTLIQLACLVILWVIKSFSTTSILFPLMVYIYNTVLLSRCYTSIVLIVLVSLNTNEEKLLL